MSEQKPKHHRRSSIFWPLIFITLGVVLLLNNVGSLRSDFWDSAFRFWPVLLIAIGLDGIYRGEGVSGATFMIGLGVIFLLASLGYLQLDVWWVILHFWPIFLIAFGFDILIGRRSRLASLLGMLAILAILLGGIWLFTNRGFGAVTGGDAFEEPLGQSIAGEIVLNPAVGELRVAASDQADVLVAGQVPEIHDVEIERSVDAGKATLSLSLREGSSVTFPGGGGSNVWDIALTTQIPLEFSLDMGVGNSTLDLTGLQLEGLDVHHAIGRAVITLPAEGEFYGQADLAIGELVILVPRGRALRLKVDKGIATLSLPPGFTREGDIVTSPEAGANADLVNLDVNVAIGVLSVRYLD